MDSTTHTSLEGLFAERERLNQEITTRLSELRDGDVSRQKQAELDALNRRLPDTIGDFLRRLRMYGFVMVFHDGRLEGGPGGLSLDAALGDLVRTTFPEIAGYSETFRCNLLRELQNARILDASDGLDSLVEEKSGDARPMSEMLRRLQDLIAGAHTAPEQWHLCPEENETSICSANEHHAQPQFWRGLLKGHAFLCHDMHPDNAALAVAAVNALPELIKLAADGLRYRSRFSDAGWHFR